MSINDSKNVGKTITGTAGDDTLTGTNYADTISGLDGYDTINGLAGNDTLNGGALNDTINGGDGDDLINGGDGLDYLSGGAGNDYIDGGTSYDQMAGGLGNDTYIVDDFFDDVQESAGEGTDTILASVSYNLYSWSVGNTRNVENLTLTGTGDIDAAGDDSANILTGNSGSNDLFGNGGNDQLFGGDGNDVLVGGDGNDIVSGGTGQDLFRFFAGDGQDTVKDLAAGETVEIYGYVSAQSITQVGTGVVVTLSAGDQITFQNSTVAAVQAALAFPDAPHATEGDDALTGTDLDNTILGLGGEDMIDGRGGDDILSGNGGSDTIDGGDGNDALYSGDVTPPYGFPYIGGTYTPPQLDTGIEVDTLNGGAGDDVIFAGYGDNVDGGDNNYGDQLYISFQGATSGISFDARLETQVIGGGTITGVEFPTWVEGSNYDDYINVTATNYNGYGGNAVVFGMGGNDTLIAGYTTGWLDGGEGNDIVDGRGSQYLQMVEGGAGDDILYTNINTFAVASGGDGNDTIYSHGETHGGNGNDTIVLNYSYYPGLVTGDAGDDSITGTFWADNIQGNDGSDTLDAGDGSDIADGGAGEDLIVGGGGNDTLTGGADNDKFVFRLGDGQDVITDFAAGDVVEFDGYEAVQSIAQIGSDVVVVLSGTDQITFSNTDVATVQAGLHFAPPSDDTLIGGAGDDVLLGLGGDDTISGEGGNDTVAGGAGSDSVDGGDGADIVYSDDVSPPYGFPYYGNPYDPPLLDTGTEVDTLTGGAGDDVIFAGYGDNVDGGDQDVYGDKLLISFLGATSGVTVDFRQDTQVIGGGTITGIENISWVQGSNYDDDINVESYASNGYSNFTVVLGMGGDDTLVSGYYTSVLDGGDGNDVVDGRNSQYLQEVNGGAGDDILYTNTNTFAQANGGDGNDIIYSHATTHGGNGDDTIILSYSYYPGQVYGDAGDDSITGNVGDDILIGNSGADTIDGSDGNDTLFSGEASLYGGGYPTPILDRGTEVDTLNGGAGDDVIFAGYGDNVDGGTEQWAGDKLYISFQGATSGVTVDFRLDSQVVGGGTITGIENISWVEGSDYDDNIDVRTANWNSYSDFNSLYGMGGNDTLIGGDHTSLIDGGDGDDFIDGSSSWYLQIVNGGSGNDIIYTNPNSPAIASGGDGDDQLYTNAETHGGAGNDIIHLSFNYYYSGPVTGDDGDDQITGAEGDDLLIGNSGADTINGGDGNDRLAAGDVNIWNELAPDNGTEHDMLNGGYGDDLLSIGYGDDAEGGEGFDTLYFSFGGATEGVTFDAAVFGSGQPLVIGGGTIQGIEAVSYLVGSAFQDHLTVTNLPYPFTVEGAGGDDFITVSGDDIAVYGGDGFDRIDILGGSALVVGGEGSDSIWVEGGTVVAFGGEGGDYFVSGAGADTFYGEDGSDTVSYLLSATGVAVSLQGQIAPAGDILYSIENVTGSNYSDSLTGDWFGNHLEGLSGNDTLEGLDGDDLLDGGAGNDTMLGGWGNDIYLVDSAGDIVTENANEGTEDTVLTWVGYVLGANIEDAQAEGSAAINLTGNSLANSLTGNSAANTLDGGAGDDTLEGGAGNDIFVYRTGGGKDTIVDLAAGDIVNIYGYSSAQSVTQVGSDVVLMLATGSQLTFLNTNVASVQSALHFMVSSVPTAGDDVLTGTSGNDTIGGLGGNDTISGLAGNDALDGGAGNDLIDGGAGVDLMKGGAGNDIFILDDAGDKIAETSTGGTDEARTSVSYTLALGVYVETLAATGTAAINLTGNSLAQTLVGNGAANALSGMGGSDILKGGGGNDILTGGAGSDIFVFETAPGNDRITDFQRGLDKIDLSAFHIGMGQVHAVASGADTVLQIDSNSDGVSDFAITLTGIGAPTSLDYIL